MSTYTDLKNRVKETITVGFRPEDRVTTLKVRFYNEENEYWGSFSGSLSGKVNIKTGNILSVDIYDSTLINPILKTKEGTIIDLGTMGNQLEELSVHVHENVKTSVDTNYELITQLSDAISAVPLDTESQLSSLDFRLNNLSTECKQAMSDEVSARISSDNQLSLSFDNKLTTLALYVDKEDEKLKSEINNLSELLNTEITTRISEDEKLSVNLSKYSDRKRHYELFSMDMASQMPIKAKEFAVNKLINYNVPDGFVINNDAGGLVIGHIEDYNDATKACKFTAYSDADYTVTNENGTTRYPYKLILELNPYIFDESQTQKPCANNVHILSYNRSGTFNEHQFDISLMKSNVRNVLNTSGTIIGHVFDAGTCNEVSSGILLFNPTTIINDTILSVFANTKLVQFSTSIDNGVINEYDNGNSILQIQNINQQPRFYYEAGISQWPQKLIFGNFAKIYLKYYNKNINKDLVESFAVSIVPDHNSTLGLLDYFLSIDNNFETIIKEYEDNSFDLLKYDINDKKLSYTREKKLFECPVIITERNTEISVGLSSTIFNTHPIVASNAKISLNGLSKAINDDLSSLIIPTYELERNNDVLSCDLINAESRVKIILKNTGKIDITLSAANGTTVIFGDDNDRVEFNALTVYEDQTDSLGIENNLDINNISFDTEDRRVAAQGYLYITEASENGTEFKGLNFCKEYISNKYGEIKNNDIVIEIPNKEDGSTISREFLFVINPTSTNNTKVNLKFVTEQGEPIDFFTLGNDKFEIDCRKYITFRLQEITHNKFVLLDWDQSVQESRLDNLDSRLELEISNRITAINNLSSALSTEISCLSVGLSTEIDNKFTLQSTTSKLSGEYNDLNNFVNRTLIDKNDQSKPGIVKIQDEYDYADEDTRNYEMRMISGTIVLKLIQG